MITMLSSEHRCWWLRIVLALTTSIVLLSVVMGNLRT